MADKRIVFDIGADSSAAQKALADLRSQFDATINALKGRSGEIALFRAAQQDAVRLEAQIKNLGKAGGDTTALNAALTVQRAALAQQAAALQKAGVNTNQLNAEQARLRIEADQVTRAFRSQSAAFTSANGISAGLQSFRTIVSSLSVLLPGLGAGLGVAGITEFAKGLVEAQARLYELKQITGLSIPLLNGLRLAAKDSGVDLEALAKGVEFFAKTVEAAKDPMSEQHKLLGAFGIDAETFQGKLEQLAQVFEALPDGPEKTNLAIKVLGRSGAQLIPAFNGGAAAIRKFTEEAQKLNPATTESTRSAHQLEAAWTKVVEAFKGSGSALVGSVTPFFAKYLAGINDLNSKASTWDKILFLTTGHFSPAVLARIKAQADAEAAAEAAAAKAEPAKTARLATAEANSAKLTKIKDDETEKIKDALAKQEEAYRKANSAINKTEDDRVALAEKNAARILALTTPRVAEKNLIAPAITSDNLDANTAARNEAFRNQAEARTQLIDLQTKASAALVKAVTPADFDKVVGLGEQAAALIERLHAADANAPSVLAAQQRAIAEIQDQALQGKGKAEQAIADKNKSAVDDLKEKLKDWEARPVIAIDEKSFEKSLADLNAGMAKMQASLDAKPLRIKVAPDIAPPLPQGTPSPTAPQIAWSNIPGHAAGTILPGYGGGDRWPVLAESGEAIIRKEAVRHYGPNLMAALNAMALARFAEGGIIGRSVASLPSIDALSGGGSSGVNLYLTLPNNETIKASIDQNAADILQRELRLAALKYGRRR